MQLVVIVAERKHVSDRPWTSRGKDLECMVIDVSHDVPVMMCPCRLLP